MATNGRHPFKRPVRKAPRLATKSSIQKHRQYGDGVRRDRNEDIIYLDLPRGEPGEPTGAVMMSWTRRLIVLLFGRTVGRVTMLVITAGRIIYHGQRRVAVDPMPRMVATAKKRMATHRDGRQDGKDCFHVYSSILRTIIVVFAPDINPTFSTARKLAKNG